MKLRVLVVAACVVCKISAPSAQVPGPSTLTPDQIQAAMELGNTGKPQAYKFDFGKDQIGWVVTPFMRVALAARRAKESYKPFTVQDATALNDGLVYVAAYRFIGQAFTVKGGQGKVIQPEQVLVMPKDSKNISDAIRPDKTETETSTHLWMGSELTQVSVVASFPISVLSKDNEFVVIYAEPVWFGKREFRIHALCGKYSTRGCVNLDRRDPLSER
jgi:hypothetical protein